MSDCCSPQPAPQKSPGTTACPLSGTKGKRVGLITLKSQLKADALATLDSNPDYFFCPEETCNVVYFSGTSHFRQQQVKLPVFQKDPGDEVPACYCFDWTRTALARAVASGVAETVPISIAEHVKAGRCGCEVNNPQGSCCLGNVRKAIEELAGGIA